MPSRHVTAVARLADRLKQRVGEAATYVRDDGLPNQSTAPITVISGRERDVVRDPARAAAWSQQGWDRDVLIPVAELTAAGIAEPVAGDRVRIGTLVLEAFEPDGERAWRYSDATRTMYRIHCRAVKP